MVIHFRRFALLSFVRFEKSIIQKCPCSKEEIKIRNCCAYSPKLRNYKLHHPSSIQILRNPILSSSCLAVEWLSLINMVLYKKKPIHSFIFIFPQTTWSISHMLQEWIRQERQADNRTSFKGTTHFSQASGESKLGKIHLQKNEDLKRNVNKYYFAFEQLM